MHKINREKKTIIYKLFKVTAETFAKNWVLIKKKQKKQTINQCYG